ncbi:MAG: His/Gly/Thr/Pro-type tRNA ligase C-terminal domain-containing protein [Chloroflexia bacterium]
MLVAIVRDGDDDGTAAALGPVTELRAAGLRAEVYLNERRGLRDQFNYANRRGIPYIVLAGGDEQARGAVKLRDLSSGEEREVRHAEVADTLVKALRGG